MDYQCLRGESVDDIEATVGSPAMGPVVDEVIGPDIVAAAPATVRGKNCRSAKDSFSVPVSARP